MSAEESPCPPKLLELLENGKITLNENLLVDEVDKDVRTSPLNAPDIVTRALETKISNPLTFAGHIIQRSIEALGQNPDQLEVALSVRASVKAQPTAVLEIVRAAIQASPPRFHSNVVAAAVAAVLDPYLRIEVTTILELFGEKLHTVRHPIWWDRIVCTEGDQELVEEAASGYITTTAPDAYTLAEAILEAAIQAGSPENIGSLRDAMDLVLTNDLEGRSIVGNPADSSSIVTKPPPSTPSPTPPPVSP